MEKRPLETFSRKLIVELGTSDVGPSLIISEISNGKQSAVATDIEPTVNDILISIRYQVSTAKPVNYSEEASRLMALINSYGLS